MPRPLLREILVHAGAAWLTAWLALPLVFLFNWLFPPRVVEGEWALLLLAFQGELPIVLVWCFCAALAALITEVKRPLRWALALAAVLVLVRAGGWNWQPGATLQDRVFFIIPSVLGGCAVVWVYMAVIRWRATRRQAADAIAA